MLADGTVEAAWGESVDVQPIGESYAGIGDKQPSCDGSQAAHRSAHMIRAVHLCLE